MRIGLVSLHTSPLDAPGRGDAGGMNVVVRAVADELARAGHSVEVLTRAASVTDADRAETLASGARVRYLAAGEPGPLAKEELPRVTAEFGRMLAQLPRFDVLHAHYWLSGRAALPVARATGAAHLLSLHTVAALKNARRAPGDAPEPQLRIDAERMLACESDAVIASTRTERDAIVDAYGTPPGRVEIVPPGVDTTLFHPPAAGGRPGESAAERPLVLVVGRIQPLKAQDLAIRAVSRIPPGSRPLLHIAGEVSGAGNAAYAQQLRRLVAERGLAEDVIFLGTMPRAELAALMRRCALVLVPSLSETYGLVTLESAASGVPVIASRAPGLVDAVDDGVTGILVPERDEVEWAVAIDGLLRDPVRRARLGRASVGHAHAHSWAATASRLAKLYERVAESP